MPVSDFHPLVEQLDPAPEPEEAFKRLAHRRHCLFLDSALRHPRLGRYSFLMAQPFDYLEVPADRSDGLGKLAEFMRGYQLEDLPPFQGGAAGLFSYEFARSLEPVPAPKRDPFAVPALAIGLYDVVLAWDHVTSRAYLISQGFPEHDPNARRSRAQARLGEFKSWLAPGVKAPVRTEAAPIARDQLPPLHPVGDTSELQSDFTKAEYLAAVARAIEYIRAGDIFQVNLSQRLFHPAIDDSVALYCRMRKCNPAPFAGYFDMGSVQVCSASPERFLEVDGRTVETRPIKGTRARTARPEADLFAGDDLRSSEKDRAENIMIVDLLRNDLSRVCQPESVRVTQLCELETYAYVQHLVSAVRGELPDDATPIDLLRATFPGGSITGAPKVRAMQIISELESSARGPYCGSLGYIGFGGRVDLSILIRTITAGSLWWQIPVGGGIVAQSTPAQEYEETWHKAEGLLRALKP